MPEAQPDDDSVPGPSRVYKKDARTSRYKSSRKRPSYTPHTMTTRQQQRRIQERKRAEQKHEKYQEKRPAAPGSPKAKRKPSLTVGRKRPGEENVLRKKPVPLKQKKKNHTQRPLMAGKKRPAVENVIRRKVVPLKQRRKAQSSSSKKKTTNKKGESDDDDEYAMWK